MRSVLGIFNIQLDAKIKITKQRGLFWRHERTSGRKYHNTKKTIKPNRLCCLVTKKVSKNMVPRSDTPCKHPSVRLVTGRPILVLWKVDLSVGEQLSGEKNDKTGTSKVGAISKAQKAQNIFLEKNLKFSKKKIFFRRMSHSAEKCKRGDPFWFPNMHSVAKLQKTQRGDPLGTLKNFRKKVAQCREKSKRGTL